VLGADRPAVLEAITDPNVPPLPPHISFEQARHFMSSVYHGDADALGFVTQTLKDAVESFLPHKK
jgi:pyruvate dehydrogenase (quinone)